MAWHGPSGGWRIMAMAMVMAMVTDGGDSRLEWLVGSEKVSRKKEKKKRERE